VHRFDRQNEEIVVSLATDLLTKRSAFKPKAYPETPYNSARREWNDRTGALVKQAYNWRLAFFAQFLISIVLVAGLLYKSAQSSVQPYLIEHNAATGEAIGVGRMPAWNYTPQENEYRHFLGSWLQLVRAVSIDSVVVKHNWLDAYRFTTQAAANQLNDWAQKDERLSKIGQETVSVEVISINPIAESHSYQIRWTETVRTKEGTLKEQHSMTGIFPVKVEPPNPQDEAGLRANPLGIKIDGGFQWSKDV
jgi:type IV secretory pathway TrbF-like protein